MEYVRSVANGRILAAVFRRWRIGVRKSRMGVPLLVASSSLPCTEMKKLSKEEISALERVVQAMGDAGAQLLEHLHLVSKHLEFWKAREQGTDSDKVRFMILERGPWAFFQGVSRLVRACFWEVSPAQGLFSAAASRISERVRVLTDFRTQLATLIGQVHMKVDKMGAKVSSGHVKPKVAISECMVAVIKAMAVLEGDYELPQSDYDSQGNSFPGKLLLKFDNIPDTLGRRMEWTNSELQEAIQILFNNLWKLDNFLTTLMWQYRRPRKLVRKWMQYSGSALGLGVASGWLVSHSRLSGSNDLDRWFQEGVEASSSFLKEHIQQPLLSIRDELFNTFRKRHRDVEELGDVKLTAASFHRMLKDYVAQKKGAEVADHASEQELMENLMERYEEEVTHPVKNLLSGELVRAVLIQVQKLKLDIETAMLELNQILRANEINFAVLAALPALLFSIAVGWLLRRPFIKGKGAEGRGRQAQLKRRMLMADAEKAVMICQISIEEGEEDDAVAHFGTLIYCLDRLYKAVKKPAKATGEWSSLQKDIVDLAKPRLSTYYKLSIAARMERVYDCLVPMPQL
ncbi:hypothetical protein BDL97_10G066500 [Sphagnum fallax]|nr:hypothetical protein BDL97_10G066500 [Sphagnum fallax]